MRVINFAIPGTVDPAITTAGTTLIWKAPSDAHGGGVTILEAYVAAGAGTMSVKLYDMGAAGTAIAGTVADCSLTAAAAQVKGTAAVDYWLDGARYLGVAIGVGTAVQPIRGWVTYTPGR